MSLVQKTQRGLESDGSDGKKLFTRAEKLMGEVGRGFLNLMIVHRATKLSSRAN